MVDIPVVPEGGRHGVYEDLHGFAGGAELSDHIATCALKNYGLAIDAFLAAVVKDLDGIGNKYAIQAEEIRGRFTRGISAADGESLRVAQAFSIVAAAGELATTLGVTGWPVGAAELGAKECFKAWLTNRGVGSSDDKAGIELLRTMIQIYGDSRFE